MDPAGRKGELLLKRNTRLCDVAGETFESWKIVTMTTESPRISWFVAVLCVHKHGGFSGAADYLGCSQSAVTRQVAQLDSWLGNKIFSRNIPPRPTDFGSYFLPICEDIVRNLYIAKGAIHKYDQNMQPIKSDPLDLKVMNLLAKVL